MIQILCDRCRTQIEGPFKVTLAGPEWSAQIEFCDSCVALFEQWIGTKLRKVRLVNWSASSLAAGASVMNVPLPLT